VLTSYLYSFKNFPAIIFFQPTFATMAGTLGTAPLQPATAATLFDSIKTHIIPDRKSGTDHVKKTRSRQFTESGLCKSPLCS
jgi:hypothetical protein